MNALHKHPVVTRLRRETWPVHAYGFGEHWRGREGGNREGGAREGENQGNQWNNHYDGRAGGEGGRRERVGQAYILLGWLNPGAAIVVPTRSGPAPPQPNLTLLKTHPYPIFWRTMASTIPSFSPSEIP